MDYNFVMSRGFKIIRMNEKENQIEEFVSYRYGWTHVESFKTSQKMEHRYWEMLGDDKILHETNN